MLPTTRTPPAPEPEWSDGPRPPSPALENERCGLGNFYGLPQSEMPGTRSCHMEMGRAEPPAITLEGHGKQEPAKETAAEAEGRERPHARHAAG